MGQATYSYGGELTMGQATYSYGGELTMGQAFFLPVKKAISYQFRLRVGKGVNYGAGYLFLWGRCELWGRLVQRQLFFPPHCLTILVT